MDEVPASARAARAALEDEGYAVSVADSARGALAHVAAGPVDLILLDLALPELDGVELARRLHAAPGCEDVPVVAVTGLLHRLEAGCIADAGFAAIVSKPFERAHLVRCVVELTGRARGAALPLAGRVVLVANDAPEELRLARVWLEDAGATVGVARDGIEALSLATTLRPDVIVLDALMPKLDGVQLCWMLRTDPERGTIPVILHGAPVIGQADDELARRIGASAVLSCASGGEPLVDAVVRALGQGAGPVPAGRAPADGDYTQRMVRQLERQLAHTLRTQERCITQAATLTLMSTLSRSMYETGDVARSVDVMLAQSLDAAGLAMGAVYLLGHDARFRLGAQVGLDRVPEGHESDGPLSCGALFRRALEEARPIVARRGSGGELDRLCERLGARSLMLVPVAHEGRPLGLLLMASADRELAVEAWSAFATVIAVHLAQTLAVMDAYARVIASERRNRALLMGATDAIFQLDTSGVIREANANALDVLGGAREDVVGHHFSEFAPGLAEAERHRNAFARTLATGSCDLRGVQVLRPTGEIRELDVRASLVATGESTIVLAIATDATEVRRIERRTHVEHVTARILSHIQNVEEAAPLLLDELVAALGWDVGIHWAVRGPVPALVAMSSRTPAAAPRLATLMERGAGLPPPHVFDSLRDGRAQVARAPFGAVPGTSLHAAEQDGFLLSIAVPIGSGADLQGMLRFLSKGVLAPDAPLLASLESAGAQLAQLVRRRRSEIELLESERRFRLITENLPQVFWVASGDGRSVHYVSPAFERVWGRSCQSLYDAPESWQDSIVDEDRDAVARCAREAAERPVEYRIRRPDGTVRVVRSQTRSVRADTGQVVARTGVTEDVTEMRDLQQRFLQAQKMEAFGQLAGGVAHDFNNLLTVIKGYTELALEDLADSPTRAAIEPVRKATDRATALTRQLLAFSRKQVLRPRTLDLNAVVRDVEKMLRRLIGEDIELETRLDAGLPAVLADPSQMEQVLLNLAVNARDAMPSGGRLVISTHAVDGATAELTVQDTGCGMTEDVQRRIFEPFFTTKDRDKGTGLGLSTVMGIVQQSGGSIRVDSRPGHGTAFRITLPPAPRESVAAPREPAAVAASHVVRPLTVLVIEDDGEVANLTAARLRRRGHEALVARTLSEARLVAQANAGRLDLILSDVVMPGAPGPEIVAQVRNLVGPVPVIYTSGYTDEAMVRHGLNHGEVNFLQKPFSAEALDQAILASGAAGGSRPR